MLPFINLIHLKFFCDAATYKSVSEAAKMNFVTQSAVSQAIGKLEKVVGADLVSHSRQKFQLTEAGQILFEQARNIFKSVQDTFDKIHQTKEEITGGVKFVSTHSLGMSFIPHAYNHSKLKYPQLDVKFRMGGLNFIRNALKQEEADFAIVVYDQDFAQFTAHPLKKGKFHLYHTEGAPHQVLFTDLKEGMHVQSLKKYFDEKEHSIQFQAGLGGWDVVARFTEMKMGIGFLPEYIVTNNRYSSLRIFPQEIPHYDYEICVIHNKDKRLSRAAHAFLEHFTVPIIS